MKKYIYIICLVGMILPSCTKKFDDINTDPSRFENATPEAIMAGAIKRTNDAMANNNTQRWWDIAHFIIQQGNRYDVTDARGNGIWKTMYVDVLNNIQQVIRTYGSNPAFNNRVQAARIWRAYVYSLLVSQFGVIPITQANNVDYLQNITFNTEDEAYAIILNELKDAASKINPSGDRFTYDVLYGGNMLSWKKFGNTLRLRVALQCTRNLGEEAKKNISEAMSDEANLINTETETAKMNYENVINNENPYYIRFKRNTFTLPQPKMSDFILLYFRSYKDPRLEKYYAPVPLASRYLVQDTLKNVATDSMYVVSYPIPYNGFIKAGKLPSWTSFSNSVDPLQASNINSFSEPVADVYAANRPFVVLSYAESQFLKAEARELGLGGAQLAEAYYYSGIDACFNRLGITAAELNAYKARDGIKWNTQGKGFSNYLGNTNADIPMANMNKIWVQRWLNYYPDGAFETWNLQRRTRAMRFPPHTNPANSLLVNTAADIPHRGSYPTDLVGLNPVGYADALKKLGINGIDDTQPTTYLKFEAPYTVSDWTPTQTFYNLAYLQKWYGTTVEELKASGTTFTILSKYK